MASNLTTKEFQKISECFVLKDQGAVQNCDKLLKEDELVFQKDALCELKPQKVLVSCIDMSNKKELFRQKEKAYVQTLEVINMSLIPYFIEKIEEKRPNYHEKEFYRYKRERLEGLMTNIMEFIRLTNLDPNIIKTYSETNEKSIATQLINEIDTPKRRNRTLSSKNFDCHYKDCAKVYNSRSAVSFHMKKKHSHTSDELKDGYFGSNINSKKNSLVEDFVNNEKAIKVDPKQNIGTNFFTKNEKMEIQDETIRIHSCKEDSDQSKSNEDFNRNGEFSSMKQQAILHDDMINFFEQDSHENRIQKHPFFIGFEEDDIDRFSIPRNEINGFSQKDKYSIFDHENTPIYGKLTGEDELDNDSLQSFKMRNF